MRFAATRHVAGAGQLIDYTIFHLRRVASRLFFAIHWKLSCVRITTRAVRTTVTTVTKHIS